MSDEKPPLPKERWKGPPEGVPDYVGSSGNAGRSTSSLLVVASLLILAGLWPLIHALVVLNWAIGPNFWLFVSGVVAGSIGGTLVWIARRWRSRPEQSEIADAPRSPSERNGCLTLLMVLAGSFLLLPGFCSLFIGLNSLGPPWPGVFDSINFVEMFLIGCVAGSTGVGLIWWSVVRPPAAAGLMTLAGLALLVPGLYFVLYGTTRLYWADQTRFFWMLIGLPGGLALLAAGLHGRRQNGPPIP